MIRKQQELTEAVLWAFPGALSILEIDARQSAVVETVGMAFVDDEISEVSVEILRGPTFFTRPFARCVLHGDQARAVSTHSVADADHKLPITSHGRLHNPRFRRPRVSPKQLSVCACAPG